MTLSAIHNKVRYLLQQLVVVCDIGGYDFVSYSQLGVIDAVGDEGCL